MLGIIDFPSAATQLVVSQTVFALLDTHAIFPSPSLDTQVRPTLAFPQAPCKA